MGDDGIMVSGDTLCMGKNDSCSYVHVDADEVNLVTGAVTVSG